MLSFTKYPPGSQTTLASDHESRLDYLSLTQDSYLPLPEKKSHVAHDLPNQLHQSTSRDLYNAQEDQSQNANLSRGLWLNQSHQQQDTFPRASPTPESPISKENHGKKSLKLSPKDQISDIPTLSHTNTSTTANIKEKRLTGGEENTSDMQTLSHTISGKAACGGKYSNSSNGGDRIVEPIHLQQQQQQQQHFMDSSIRTLSYTTTSGEPGKHRQENSPNVDNTKTKHGLSPGTKAKTTPENDRKSPLHQGRETALDDDFLPRTKVKLTPKSRKAQPFEKENILKNSQEPTSLSHGTSSSSTTLASKERNTLSLLTSDRTLSELANLRLSSSASSPHDKSISQIVRGAEYPNQGDLDDLPSSSGKNQEFRNQDEQDLSDSSLVTKDTLDLISQLLSNSRQHQPSDTESSELFTVGRLSLSRLEQSRLLDNMDDDMRGEVLEVCHIFLTEIFALFFFVLFVLFDLSNTIKTESINLL